MERVVQQVAQQRLGEWQLVGAAGVPVDGKARQVLQGGKDLRFAQRMRQPQRHSLVLSHVLGWVGLILSVDVARSLALWRVA